MKKNYLKNSNQLGNIVSEILLLNQEELIKNILDGKEKKKIFEEVYKNYKGNQKNITSEFYSNDFHYIISDLNILKEYFGEKANISIEDLNNDGFVNDMLVFYSLEIAKREYFGKEMTVKNIYNFVKEYNDSDKFWEEFYDFLKENEIKRIMETAESVAEEIKYLLKTDVKAIPVSELLKEKKEIFNSENENFVIVTKENNFAKESSVLDEIFSIKEFDREKTFDKEIIKFLEKALEETENI